MTPPFRSGFRASGFPDEGPDGASPDEAAPKPPAFDHPEAGRRWTRLRYRIVDSLSFGDAIRDIADALNRGGAADDDATPDLLSHPGGFARAFHKRRLGMAEAYRRITGPPDPGRARKRLHALKRLMELSLHAKTASMPLNTARVQIEMMKTAVRTRHDPRRQMELIADFSRASHGREVEIRRFLAELGRIETPETGRPLRELDLGWDDHVHDHLSEGRKTPSQVVLDAFLKGMSRLTLAYYDLPGRDTVFEGAEAGRILGVDVGVGIEFSVGPARRRHHFMFLPPASERAAASDFFDRHCRDLAEFADGLEENRIRRRRVIAGILEEFNRIGRASLNEGFPGPHPLALPPLAPEDLERMAPHGQFSRNHLGELLCVALRETLWLRTVSLRSQYEVSAQLHRRGRMTAWELEQVAAVYGRARTDFTRLNPGDLRDAFLSGKAAFDYDSAFPDPAAILPQLGAVGGTVVFHRPLAFGLAAAAETLIRHHRDIHRVELVNLRDSLGRDPAETIQLARFVSRLNAGDADGLRDFLARREIGGIDPGDLARAAAHYAETPLRPVLGSASTGWEPEAPGMGFVAASRIPPRSLRRFTRTHYRLPRPVSELVATGGLRDDASTILGPIHCLGRRSRFRPNEVGDEDPARPIGFRRAWRYLNPTLKNLIRAGIGWLPARAWLGPGYAFVWFAITFIRNVLVDLTAFSGLRIRAWSLRDIDFDNVSQSLFWTGFSVPTLGAVKLGFERFRPLLLPEHPAVFVWAEFLAICVANGLYIAAHNTLRGFDRRVVRANFFRSVLAWPFSALFSPLGVRIRVPDIVQAKFWSDAMAALIEGTGKFHRKVVLRRRDIEEILPRLADPDRDIRLTAMLDLLFIWARRQRGRTGLARTLLGRRAGWAGLFRKKAEGVRAEDLNRIADLFRPQEARGELIRMILERYNRREALELSRLVREHLVPFHDWIRRLRRREGLRD